jgi:hypothetical protein
MRIVLKWRFDTMTICRCLNCRLGFIAAGAGAWFGVNTASCFLPVALAPEVDAVPVAALAAMTMTTVGTGLALKQSFLNDRPAAMADEPIRMPPIAQRIAASEHEPEPMLARGMQPYKAERKNR